MKVNSQNYYQVLNQIGLENLSPALKKGHELIDRATKQGSDWKAYQSFKKPFDLQFQALELLMAKSTSPKAKSEGKEAYVPQKANKSKAREPKQKRQPKTPETTMPDEDDAPEGVELILPEVTFMKRFALLHNKTKTMEQIGSFIRSLQKAITERRIRKNSPYADTIQEIQKRLIAKYQEKGKVKPFVFTEKELEQYKRMGGAQVVMASIRFIKSFVSLNGREITKEKAKALYNRIVTALEKNRLSEQDRYFGHIKVILKTLESFVKSSAQKELNIPEAQLSGLEGILRTCSCSHELKGIDEDVKTNIPDLAGLTLENRDATPRHTILNSQQVIGLKSQKLNFSGKWLNFIGNPSKGFTAMIYGKPKFGKSYLAIDFAGYLARHHGKVLYVAYEEGFDDTMKQKLQDKRVAHPNLFVSDYLPKDLSEYEYLFIDSVNKAQLSPEDLDLIERRHPGTSFVYIFQTTKDGNFKGAMEYKHNVDVVIEVPERGKAVQFGRFNQGGEMNIFG